MLGINWVFINQVNFFRPNSINILHWTYATQWHRKFTCNQITVLKCSILEMGIKHKISSNSSLSHLSEYTSAHNSNKKLDLGSGNTLTCFSLNCERLLRCTERTYMLRKALNQARRFMAMSPWGSSTNHCSSVLPDAQMSGKCNRLKPNWKWFFSWRLTHEWHCINSDSFSISKDIWEFMTFAIWAFMSEKCIYKRAHEVHFLSAKVSIYPFVWQTAGKSGECRCFHPGPLHHTIKQLTSSHL